MKTNIGIIIQARSGSTRLPGKMMLPFYESASILTVIIQRIQKNLDLPLVLATTTNAIDDELVRMVEAQGVEVFRGDEDDVLSRFTAVNTDKDWSACVRVCADNPYLNMELLQNLIAAYQGEDYLSYQTMEAKPTILSHYGVFAELVSAKALLKAAQMTKEKLYREHVTNFIYNNPSDFSCRFLELPSSVSWEEGIRLTIDTKQDFENVKELFHQWPKAQTLLDLQELFNLVLTNSLILQAMRNEQSKNSK